MPATTPLQRRDKALFVFLMLTGARDGAVASLRFKHIDLVQVCVYQDGRDVKRLRSCRDIGRGSPHATSARRFGRP
jgi:integrase